MAKLASAILMITVSSLIFAETAAAKKTNTSTITCETFLVLEPGVQERIVWWMEGWDDSGDRVEDAVEEDFERPIEVIVTACKETPNESLWQKIKSLF
jgi:hypothetical protein